MQFRDATSRCLERAIYVSYSPVISREPVLRGDANRFRSPRAPGPLSIRPPTAPEFSNYAGSRERRSIRCTSDREDRFSARRGKKTDAAGGRRGPIQECFDAASRREKHADLQIKFRSLVRRVSGVSRVSTISRNCFGERFAREIKSFFTAERTLCKYGTRCSQSGFRILGTPGTESFSLFSIFRDNRSRVGYSVSS